MCVGSSLTVKERGITPWVGNVPQLPHLCYKSFLLFWGQ